MSRVSSHAVFARGISTFFILILRAISRRSKMSLQLNLTFDGREESEKNRTDILLVSFPKENCAPRSVSIETQTL